MSIVDVATGDARTIEAPSAVAAIGFMDQVWVAAEARLSRYTLRGEPIDAIALPQDARATLVAAAVGAPAALWTSATPIAVVEEDVGLVQLDRVGPRIVAPVSGRRWVTATSSYVTTPSGTSCELGAGTQVVAGAIALDGTAVALVVERAGGRELVVVGLTSGRLQLRRPLHAAAVRVAARRGLAAMLVGPSHFTILDLRSGRVVGELAHRAAITDFAIDPDARHLAVRSADVATELVPLSAATRISVCPPGVREPVPVAIEVTEHVEIRRVPAAIAAIRHGRLRALEFAELGKLTSGKSE